MILENVLLGIMSPKIRDLETSEITLERWKSCMAREKWFRNICSEKVLDRPLRFTKCPWFKIAEPQKMHFKEKIRPWESGVGHRDMLEMLPNDLRTLEGWPLHTQGGIPLMMLFCAHQHFTLKTPWWLQDWDAAWCCGPPRIGLLEQSHSLPLIGVPPLRAPEASSLDLEGELILMSLATEHNPMGLSLPSPTT